ncbi:exopolysaccharide biosynthesis polyprenyl glycosylphosphotransferase [Arenibacter sp. BSSL-BM3]|uniref:Exopolysaccharide biosynthesis polyprenyl glycosylphosphotransferase n=1 Tax=Arenibacter arenosicollis TaxID=2762274 RepID=A0ABR7QIW4_9FLAO|nr:exopolysaccharide biosynthesis polyprenyl glycosylphosphotransferase [Arenibacter arenosicollis]MBC8766905.1 exopolysaccharide biosynthesis polyprenyl glycosylphosphotransferase [Arenibacter arenosicollis]
MFSKKHRYSSLITPISYAVDLLVINLFANILPINFEYPILFHSYLSLAWIILSFKNNFYEIYRYTKVSYILKLLFNQFVFLFLILYAFIGFFKQPNMSRLALGEYFVSVGLAIFTIKFLNYILLMKYRESVKGNMRNVVVIGKNKKTDQLIDVFNVRREFGYHFMKQFSPNDPAFDIYKTFVYIVENNIDEIYCSVSELKNNQITEFINFADNNLKTLKFIPDNKNIFSKKLTFEYYDYIPILSLRDIPLHNPLNSALKRGFDIVFSLIVVIGILSWLAPIIALIIRLETKGPVYFRQKRNGIDNKEFYCYKFRSMAPNDHADSLMAVKNDMRTTKVGKFIRRTSIDELPQFYNVLFGNMSVVGPRPHMVKHTNEFANKVDKYMLRHFVKPGITGLAQVRGYRGEIETDNDILNRTKFDIFYIENWSLFMDLKIIVQTVMNAISGDKKAY